MDLIKRSNRILVLPSSPPDGDSIGSAIALYIALKKLQKEVTVICGDPVPDVFDFLPNVKMVGNKLISSSDFIITLDCKRVKTDKIKNFIEDDKVNIIITPKEGNFSENDISFTKGKIDYDLIITTDCAELNQLRGIYENNIELFHQLPILNIDHHISNTHFGKINYVDIMASSATELILPILEELTKSEGIDLIDEDIATLLLTGIITDTGSFQNANTTPRAFERASRLIAYGARQQEIIQYVYKTKQLSQLKLWGRVLSKIQTDEKHHIVWSVVSQQDFRDTGSLEEETGDIIDELMTNAPGAEIVILMKEKKEGGISVSIRTTTPTVDAAKIAEEFGGGGHTQAAGFRMEDVPLMDAEYKVINVVRQYQAKRLNIVDGGNADIQAPMQATTQTSAQAAIQTSVQANTPQPPAAQATEKQPKHTKERSKKFEPKIPEPDIQKNEEPRPPSEITYKFED